MSFWDLSAGDALPSHFELGPISRTDIVRYQGASGDFQPVHHDEGFAREAGYEAPLVVGMYPAGALCTWAAERFGPQSVRETRMRFTAMVWPDDQLRGDGVIRSMDAQECWVDFTLKNQKGALVLTCSMRFVRAPQV